MSYTPPPVRALALDEEISQALLTVQKMKEYPLLKTVWENRLNCIGKVLKKAQAHIQRPSKIIIEAGGQGDD